MLLAVPVAGLAVAVHSMAVAFRDMYVFPFWDMISVQATLFVLPWYDFVFFRDNEHLPFLAMPFFAADNFLFEARGTFLIASILALTALMAALMVLELRRCWGRADLALAAAAGVTVAAFFWLIHFENLIWPKQVHMYLSAVFTLIAGRHASTLEVRLRRDGAIGARPVASLGLLLIAATFSFGYGAIGWIAALILAVTGRWPKRTLAILSGLFALTATVYAIRYNYAVPHPSPLGTLGDPLGLVIYVGYYLAHPVVALLQTILDRGAAVSAGLAATATGAAGAALFLVRTLFLRRLQASRTDLFTAFLVLFALGTGIMTALSRLPFGVEQALTSRYAIAQILFWLGLGLIGMSALRSRVRSRDTVVASGAAVVLALLVPSQLTHAATVEALLRAHWQSVLAIVNGVRDDKEVLAHIHPFPDMVADTARHLAARRWSVYADPQPHWLGQPVSALFRVEPAARCLGAFDTASDLSRLQGQSFVQGWAWDAGAERAVTWVVLVDGAGTVRALARGGLERLDVKAVYPQTAGAATGWRGYVAAPSPLPGMQAYAVLADGRSICPLSRNLPQSGSHG